MSSEVVGIGIIGAGIMGTAHADALAADHRARIVAVASIPVHAAQQLAERVGAHLTTDDYRRVLDLPDVDLVVVATPDHLHSEIAVATAQAGKAVLVEKPLATRLRDADAVVDAVRRAGVVCMASFSHRWLPHYAEAHDQIRAGNIGTPRIAYARKNDRISVPSQMLPWASDTSPAWFLSSHDIDLVSWLMAVPATDVFATEVRGVLDEMGVHTPDAIHAQVRMAEGGVSTFESCWIYPNAYPAITDSFIEVIGTDGVIHLDATRNLIDLTTRQSHQYPGSPIVNTVHGRPGGALRAMESHVLDCVVDGSEPLVTLESSRQVTAILEAIHHSATTGQLVNVDHEHAEGGTR